MKDSKEYFCNDCGQLRWCHPELVHSLMYCKNCGSINIIVGAAGSLDKDKLKSDWEKQR